MVWYLESLRTDSISSSIAMIISVVMSWWLPGRRPSILSETTPGVPPAMTELSPFLPSR